VRRFVADNPPDSLVQACAQTFLATDGDIRAVLRTIFTSEEFWNAPPKFKRPLDYFVSVLRAVNFEVKNASLFWRNAGDNLNMVVQVPFTSSYEHLLSLRLKIYKSCYTKQLGNQMVCPITIFNTFREILS
jgi:hypothetical protein